MCSMQGLPLKMGSWYRILWPDSSNRKGHKKKVFVLPQLSRMPPSYWTQFRVVAITFKPWAVLSLACLRENILPLLPTLALRTRDSGRVSLRRLWILLHLRLLSRAWMVLSPRWPFESPQTLQFYETSATVTSFRTVCGFTEWWRVFSVVELTLWKNLPREDSLLS